MGYLIKDSLGRSPFWYAVYKGADGIERRRSTKCTGKAAAREILRGLEAAELLGATGHAVEEQFRALIRETVARVTGRKMTDPTIREHLAGVGQRGRGNRLGSDDSSLPASGARF